MRVSRFVGTNSRTVLQQVRAELGPDAVIIMNRPVANGIEITAVAGKDMEAMLAAKTAAHEATPKRVVSQASSTPASEPRPAQPHQPHKLPAPAIESTAARLELQSPRIFASQQSSPFQESSAYRGMSDELMNEFKSMRSAVESQLAHLAWNESARRAPVRAKLTRELLMAGFGAQLTREIAKALPEQSTSAQARQWLEAVLARNLRVAPAGEDLVTRGGVYALVGPTGVGKTTTIAKLAARCVVKHGAASLALLTNDSYRIGGHDQLRTYARILGVAVRTIRDEEDLRQALLSLAERHLVLIDTVGMGQRDPRVVEQGLLLSQGNIARLLVVSASVQAETLEEAFQAYRGDSELAGCIMTKVDEAARTGQVLDLLIRHRLAIHYVANGQRVPEDLHLPNASYLVDRALRAAGSRTDKTSPFALDDDELGLVMGGMQGQDPSARLSAGGTHV